MLPYGDIAIFLKVYIYYAKYTLKPRDVSIIGEGTYH